MDDPARAKRPEPAYVEEELRGYLECGLLCFGFAHAVCTGCGARFVVAFSCNGRGVCPSWNGRHMAQTAEHLADHVIPLVPCAAVGDLRAQAEALTLVIAWHPCRPDRGRRCRQMGPLGLEPRTNGLKVRCSTD
jgi:hypothetical protein